MRSFHNESAPRTDDDVDDDVDENDNEDKDEDEDEEEAVLGTKKKLTIRGTQKEGGKALRAL